MPASTTGDPGRSGAGRRRDPLGGGNNDVPFFRPDSRRQERAGRRRRSNDHARTDAVRSRAVAARNAGASEIIDPRPWTVGSIAEVFERFQHIGHVLPAMGYVDEQLRELEATINATPCDVVVAGTPIAGTPFDLGRLISIKQPIRHATYELRELGRPNLETCSSPSSTLQLSKGP